MTGRVRKPTARALDAAQSRLLASSVSQDRKQSTTSATSSAAVKRNGRAVNAKGRTAVKKDQQRDLPTAEEAEEVEGEPQDDQQDLTLYCVCLGYDTGEEAMIQCEHCSNWFHFGCIGITEDLAAQIEGYACEMCQQMGLGTTRMLSGLPPPPSTSISTTQQATQATEESNDKTHEEGASNSEEEEDQAVDDDDPMGEDEDGDYEAGGGLAKKRKQASEGRAGRAARRRKVQNQEEGEGDYYSESDSDDAIEHETTPAVRKKPKANRRSSTTSARPIAQTDSKSSSVPQSEKTRAAVVKQFTTTFSSIYSASTNADAEDVAHRATSFAQAVEEELFSGFCEPDDKGVRAPRAKYTSKFRSLQFNLKTNAVFRSRIANDDLDAAGIVNISAEDLQTPELKAMAESVRAASLKNSVKEAMAVPTAKRTHKGEEEMENNSARLMAEEEAAMQEMERKKSQAAENAEQRERDRERSASVSQADSPFPDESKGAFPGSPAPGTPNMDQQDAPSESFFSSSSASRPRPRPSLTGSSSLNLVNQDGGFENETMESTRSPGIKQGSPFNQDSPAPLDPEAGSRSPTVVNVKNEAEGAMSPPPQPRHRNSSTSIDMAAIWGKAKAASPSIEPKDEDEAMEGAGNNGGGEGEQKYESDMFNFEAKEEDDDFEDALFRSEGASPVKKTPRPPTQPTSKPPAISELPPVWAGDLIITDEGGFPAFGVQVGGRPVGTDHKTWQKLLPRGLQTAGRISTHQASKYLVDCSFAPTRELSIIALLPDTTGPSEHFPHKPTGDRCIAKHSHIFDYYLNKDRIGVVQAPRELSSLVKDIYIIPLPKDHPLPEYVELLDEHVIPESGKREQNLLLCVLVLQKGVLPTIRSAPLAPSPSPVPAPPSSSHPPAASPPLAPGQSPRIGSASPFPPQTQTHSHSQTPPPTSAPPIDPSSFQSLLTSVDPTTLQSLLSNPQTLSALTAAQSQAALNVAHSQPSLPLSAPTGPRSGPPIHPSRLQAQQQMVGGGLPIDPNAYSGGRGIPTGPRTPHGPNRDGYNSQHAQFETNLTGGTDPQSFAMGDGGWQNANRGGGGGRGGGYGTPRGGGRGRGGGGGYGYSGYGQGGGGY